MAILQASMIIRLSSLDMRRTGLKREGKNGGPGGAEEHPVAGESAREHPQCLSGRAGERGPHEISSSHRAGHTGMGSNRMPESRLRTRQREAATCMGRGVEEYSETSPCGTPGSGFLTSHCTWAGETGFVLVA